MDLQRSIIIAGIAAVSYMMILAWNDDYGNKEATTAALTTIIADGSIPVIPSPANGDTPTPQAGNITPPTSSTYVKSVKPVATTVNRLIHVKTDVFDITIDPKGGDLIKVALLEYPNSNSEEDVPFQLLEQTQERTYIAQSGLKGISGTDTSEGSRPLFYSELKSYQLNDDDILKVSLITTQESGAVVEKQYIFERNSYVIKVNYNIKNKSDKDWSGAFYGKIIRDQTEDPGSSSSPFGMPTYLGSAYWTKKDPYNKYDFDDMSEKPLDEVVKGGWIAFVQHYFVSAWIPNKKHNHRYFTSKHTDGYYLLGFVSQNVNISPGSEGDISAEFYAGPKKQNLLNAVSPGLELTVDYGILWMIAQLLFGLLVFIQSGDMQAFGVEFSIGFGVGNWGVAIILLTVLIKLVFFKLSASSYRSMAKMRKVTPELTRIREQYKNDRQKQSLEMMNLYKKEQINPLGGCLPILLQMPFFIALYWVLMESVELRQAPFFLWIEDLSVLDPYFILPLLMGASMFIQTSLNPAPPDPMQAKMMKFMPVIFTVFFLFFPAGLVLYWVTNNILSISQQYVITRQIENS